MAVGRASHRGARTQRVEAVTGADEEQVDWIDEAGRTLQTLPRAEIRRRNLLHRVTATFVFHPDARLFVHRRTESKDVYPGLFDVAVGGTVTHGEDFSINACRELGEELGVRGVPVYRLFAHRFRDDASNSLTEVFACLYNGPVILQAEEVAEGYWAELAHVERLVDSRAVCPDSTQAWRLYTEQCRAEGAFVERVTQGKLEPIRCA